MTWSQTGAERRGSGRKSFIERIREVAAEYSDRGLGASAAMAEIRAALRALDRQLKETSDD